MKTETIVPSSASAAAPNPDFAHAGLSAARHDRSSKYLNDSPPESAPVQTRQAEAMQYFESQGWTHAQAAGIVANLTGESYMRYHEPGDGGKAYGVAQWWPDRQKNFEHVFHKDIRDSTPQEQLAFVNYELTRGSEQYAGCCLQQANTPEEAGAIMSLHYERPKDKVNQPKIRGQEAALIARNTGSSAPSSAPVTVARAQTHHPLAVAHKRTSRPKTSPPVVVRATVPPMPATTTPTLPDIPLEASAAAPVFSSPATAVSAEATGPATVPSTPSSPMPSHHHRFNARLLLAKLGADIRKMTHEGSHEMSEIAARLKNHGNHASYADMQSPGSSSPAA